MNSIDAYAEYKRIVGRVSDNIFKGYIFFLVQDPFIKCKVSIFQMVESSILKFWFLEAFEKFHKLGCVVRMVVESILPHAKFEPNDHRKDAPLFIHTLVSNEI